MRRRLGVIGLVVLLAAAVAVWIGLAGNRTRATVTIISPPERLTVPAGQALEVRYRVAGPAQSAELRCDDVLLATDAPPGAQELGHTWVPAGPGTACCIATALDGRGAMLASARRCLTVGADGSPVRLAEP